MKEKIKANKVVIILVLMVLMAAVVTARSSGECGDACGGAVCPLDTGTNDAGQTDYNNRVFIDTLSGTNSSENR